METPVLDLQKKEQESVKPLMQVLPGYMKAATLDKKNRLRAWKYGYDEEIDAVIISKDGTIGDVVEIQGLKIALPSVPKKVYSRHKDASNQYWERSQYPEQLSKIKSIFQWNGQTQAFKSRWVDYIEQEFDRREHGFWFMRNGEPTYITGAHYMYLQWSKIDVGYPDFREANRILYIFWEACKADNRCYGMCYLKIRRSGFSFMASEECVNIGSLANDAHVGILSKTGNDAKSMFMNKVVPINTNLPFFFKPIMDGMDRPKTELSYRIPATKITRKNMMQVHEDEFAEGGLNTFIDWRNTDDNSYDSEKLVMLVHDESGKWLPPNSIERSWKVTKTCLRLGRKIVGKCMMGSTCNSQNRGGSGFKNIYQDSKANKRNKNGQTKSGLYALFIPMEWNLEGFIDMYGMPVVRTPKEPMMGIDGEEIKIGAIDFWEAEVDSLKNDPDGLNEFYRQFPRTESHAFRDESKSSLFNLTKIYQQIDYNDGMIMGQYLTRGRFEWMNGVKDTKVIFAPDNRGRFLVSWTPRAELQNRVEARNGVKYPGNEHIGAFGCDPYDISGVVGGGGSNGSLHGLTMFNMDDAPSNEFFLEYIARPETAEIFFEEVLMACVFYGMPVLVENNKPRLLYHFKNRGYRGFAMNRPDKPFNKLSPTEREIGGIPNSSEDVKQAHAAAIESYIEKHVGIDFEQQFRPGQEMGTMPFTRTLHDWARFDIANRTKFDAAISSGLAIMACQRGLYVAEKKQSKIKLNFARYSNSGHQSELLRT